MSAVTSIALFDALATPVSHTFIPLGPDTNGVWWFEDQSQASPVGFWRISAQLTRAKNPASGTSAADRVARVKLGLHEPALETVSNNSAGLTPAPVVAYVCRTTMDVIIPERSTLQNRKDLRKMSSNLLADAQIVNMIENLQNIY